MQKSLLGIFALIAACSKPAAPELTDNDWTNGQKPCSENRLSFRNNKMAYYPKGKEPLEMFEIIALKRVPKNPELTVVYARPTLLLMQEFARQGVEIPKDSRPAFLFRVHEGRLSLVAIAERDSLAPHQPSATQKNIYNLIACPS